MKRIGIKFSILAFIVLSGLFILSHLYNDVVTEKFETYAIGKEKGLFSRGWLPDIIPTSSTSIKGSNDLDLNTSEGEFNFSPNDAQLFISNLKPFTSSQGWPTSEREKKLEADGYLAYEYLQESSRWVFYIQSSKGHAYYELVFGK